MALERVKDDTYSESERSTWTYLVYQYDILMQRNQEIFLIPSESLSELRQQLQVTLRKSFLAKYGDYVGIILGDLNQTGKQYHKEHAQALTGYWINVQK
jgi:hypothetical protein